MKARSMSDALLLLLSWGGGGNIFSSRETWHWLGEAQDATAGGFSICQLRSGGDYAVAPAAITQ